MSRCREEDRPGRLATEDSSNSALNDPLAWLTVWISGFSAVTYLLTSHGVRNHLLFLLDSLDKVLEVIT